MPEGERIVVVHADDLGMTHGANAAFDELSGIGICTSGSVMVPCPWFREICRMAERNPSLDIGVHLTLTSEMKNYKWRPLTSPPRSAGLTDDDGYFLPLPAMVRKAHPDVVEAELRAQIELAIAAGLDVTHLDDHAGTVLLPEFCPIYIRLGLEYQLPILITPELSGYGGQHNMTGVAAEAYKSNAEAARKAGLQLFDCILETPWDRTGPAEDSYRSMLAGIGEGLTFLALHFTKEGEIEHVDPASHHIRTGEYHLFRLNRFRDWFESQNFRLSGMRPFRDSLRRGAISIPP
jgi:predicted glycoside hydrolase/deacetylase ChbG (UPF0249 family)